MNQLPSQRRAVAPRWVLLGMLLSFVAAFAVAVYLYRRYVAYERLAPAHVLADADVVVQLDLEKVLLYEPFRKHLLPLALASQQNPKLKPRLERLRQHSQIELGVDMREFVFSARLDSARWLVAVGGMFPKTGVVPGLWRVLEEEGLKSTLDSKSDVLTFPNGTSAAQADDGVVLFASDLDSLNGARKAGAPATALPALGVELGVRALQELDKGGSGSAPVPVRLHAALSLAAPPELILRLALNGDANAGDADTQRRVLEPWVQRLVEIWLGPAPGPPKLEVSGPRELRAVLPIQGKQLDALAHELAKTVRLAAFSRR